MQMEFLNQKIMVNGQLEEFRERRRLAEHRAKRATLEATVEFEQGRVWQEDGVLANKGTTLKRGKTYEFHLEVVLRVDRGTTESVTCTNSVLIDSRVNEEISFDDFEYSMYESMVDISKEFDPVTSVDGLDTRAQGYSCDPGDSIELLKIHLLLKPEHDGANLLSTVDRFNQALLRVLPVLRLRCEIGLIETQKTSTLEVDLGQALGLLRHQLEIE